MQATAVLLGVMGVADLLKPESVRAVRELKYMGLDVWMLTGDNRFTAEAIGKQAGIGNILFEVLPSEKAAEIEKLQASGKKVAMVGDGINDAPALVTSDVAIAMGTGTDVAIESADIMLLGGNIEIGAASHSPLEGNNANHPEQSAVGAIL